MYTHYRLREAKIPPFALVAVALAAALTLAAVGLKARTADREPQAKEVLRGVAAFRADTSDESRKQLAPWIELHPGFVVSQFHSDLFMPRQIVDAKHTYWLKRSASVAYKEATRVAELHMWDPTTSEAPLDYVKRVSMRMPIDKAPMSVKETTDRGRPCQVLHYENPAEKAAESGYPFRAADLIVEKATDRPVRLTMKVVSMVGRMGNSEPVVTFTVQTITFRYDITPAASVEDYLQGVQVIDRDEVKARYVKEWKEIAPLASSGSRKVVAAHLSPKGVATIVVKGAKPDEFTAVDQNGHTWLLFGKDDDFGYSDWPAIPLEPTKAAANPVLKLSFPGGKPMFVRLPPKSADASPPWAAAFTSVLMGTPDYDLSNWRADYYQKKKKPKDELRWLRVMQQQLTAAFGKEVSDHTSARIKVLEQELGRKGGG